MKGRTALIRSLLFLFLLAGCVEPYYPPPGSGNGGQLVIDGYLNASKKSAVIKLSRAISLSETQPPPPERNASVKITSSSGTEYPLSEAKEGIYQVTNMSLDAGATYKLHVVTESGASYSSEEIGLLQSPSLDSVSWRPTPDGVNFYVTGHDSEKNTRYYRWTFEETFEYNVALFSDYKKVNKLPVFRDPKDWVYSCWATYPSTNVIVASTLRLASDQVSMFPIYFVPKGSRKFSHHYRLIVQQHAITQQEFEFWQLIKKTTETLGGLFDPLPGAVLGNIHNDEDPIEPVLGYFSGGFAQEKTKYVGFLELPGNLRVIDPYDFDCTGRLLYLDQLDKILPTEVFVQQFGTPLMGYVVVDENCADCTKLYGGTNVKPEDWPIF